MARTADGRWIIAQATPGHPYDDGIYRALTPVIGAPTVTVEDLPGMCGPIRGHGDDTTPLCRRNAMAYQLHGLLADIERDRARLARMRKDFAKCNLIGHIEFCERRLAFYLATWDLGGCTHGDTALNATTHDVEAVLPACTC